MTDQDDDDDEAHLPAAGSLVFYEREPPGCTRSSSSSSSSRAASVTSLSPSEHLCAELAAAQQRKGGVDLLLLTESEDDEEARRTTTPKRRLVEKSEAIVTFVEREPPRKLARLQNKKRPGRLYDQVYALILAKPGLERQDIRERIADDHGRRIESVGATLSDPRFRPGGQKPLWREEGGKFYAVSIDTTVVNSAPLRPPLHGASTTSCAVCAETATTLGGVVVFCDGCNAPVHGDCSSPKLKDYSDKISHFFCSTACRRYASPQPKSILPGLVVFERVHAFRRFAAERGLHLVFAETVDDNARDIDSHSHAYSEVIWLEKGRLTVRVANLEYRARPGDVLEIAKGTPHSIAFDTRCTYCYARLPGDRTADLDVMDAAIALRDDLHDKECARLASRIRQQADDLDKLTRDLEANQLLVSKLAKFKSKLKRSFDDLLNAIPRNGAS
ncbi:hypothetical protein CTAYLR_003195 [Chrysophaeum taylorii]|uniref:Zinc finger PHD-type domain-containing protein n=1 Tax=Chrysophaeum taylorii TaxID=2483200 RepID=A0AAD7UBT6_9STRA|nr:hypothetical protein CTAYLR_003195 [Chrysophaeum taylorii]